MESSITIEPVVARMLSAVDLRQLPVISQKSESQAEAIRGLRTQVIARHVRRGHRALAVCAATSNIGCTFVATNLAAAISQTGMRTLLIDGNLRHPKCERVFGRPSTVKGLQQYLMSSECHASDFIESEVLPSLSVLFAGGRTQNSQELLASEKYITLMDFCSREFDATIVDTSPASESSDAIRICNVISYCLIVARRNRTLIDDLKVLAGQLNAAGACIIGTVLNG